MDDESTRNVIRRSIHMRAILDRLASHLQKSLPGHVFDEQRRVIVSNLLSGEAAWTLPYSEFPIVCFVPGEPARWWRNELVGPDALAVDKTHALIAGGYTENANRLTLVALAGVGQGEEARQLASWALPLRRLAPPANEWAPVWNAPDLLDGRGDTLHLVDDGVWHCWRVADLLAAT
jgi:hypothetical protein